MVNFYPNKLFNYFVPRYCMFIRAGRLIGQVVYAGISHELVSDVQVDDNRSVPCR